MELASATLAWLTNATFDDIEFSLEHAIEEKCLC